MKKSSTMIIVTIVVIVVLAGGYAVYHSRKTVTPAGPTTTGSSSNTPTSSTPTKQAAATITYSDNGFSPASTTITSGQSVTFVNSSSSTIQVDSDPHPAHTDDTDLNVGTIAAGQSKTITVTKRGTFGIHNHLDASNRASVTIQ